MWTATRKHNVRSALSLGEQTHWVGDQGHSSQSASPHFMIVPSLACPASCSYCFGPHEGPIMSKHTVDKVAAFVTRIAAEVGQSKIGLTLHGGEPLMAGDMILRRLLTDLRRRVGSDGLDAAIQSNLWFFGEEFSALCQEFCVRISTSLDGPQDITDLQRGRGYFARKVKADFRITSRTSTILAINNTGFIRMDFQPTLSESC